MFFFIPAALLVVCSIINIWFRPSKKSHGYHRIRGSEESCLILRNSDLKSRAEPNRRLTTAFGINNAFTTTDSDYHKAFVNQAKNLIRINEDEWTTLALAAADIVHSSLTTLKDGPNAEPLLLVKFVQSLVFRIVIIKFFPESDTPAAGDVHFITTKINSLWLASKRCSGEDPVTMLNDKKELLRKLHSFIHPHSGFRDSNDEAGKENPLNWILPAYETLWRVVLHCFLEVRFRATLANALVYQAAIERFFAQPCQATFDTPLSAAGVTVKNIVDESLSLYPPTRRINRQLPEEEVAIDIEYLHHDIKTWGVEALQFLPARWPLKGAQKKVYMPFRIGRFECPAKNTFGPMMIGILVGALIGGVGGRFEMVVDRVSGDVFGPGPLEGGREAYAGLRLRKVKN
ncbi:hypothetical protein BKA65DRAFT_221631 [Rhexocercosporidium sp. MPI-PUGE-AT-0058]|nr:hypothetical protein BKA65DRAFT_221631 [Rhexocercosporidium sp. MPI-PUGE-AT-0058]